MGKHTARWSVRGHSLGGTTSAAPPGSSTGLRKGGARPRSATDAPFSQAPAQRDRTHARVRLPTHTQAGGGGTRGVGPATKSVPPRHTAGGRWRRGGRPPSPPPRERNRGKPPRPLPSRPPQESQLTGHATAAEAPRSTLGKGNDTTARPRAPEGRPGALQGHHRGPSKSRSRAGSGRAAQRRDGPHRRGEDRPRGTRQGGEARTSAASEDHGPAHAGRQEAGDRRSGPETTTPASHTPLGRPAGRDKRGEGPADRTRRAVPFAKNVRPSSGATEGPAQESATSPHRSVKSIQRARGPRGPRGGEGHGEDPHQRSLLQPQPAPSPPLPLSPLPSRAKVADDPARRTPDTWHGACGVGSSQPPPGACGGEGESHGGRRPTQHHLAPPPSGEPETGGGTAGRVSRAHTREPARRPKRAAQVARAGSGARRRPKAQRPARVQSPRTPSERRQRRPCQHLPGGKKGPFQAKKITAPGSGAHPRTSGGLPGTSARLPLPNTSPSTAAPELSRGHLVDPRSAGGGGGRGGGGGAGKRGRGSERAGVALPGSPARAGTVPRSLRVPGRRLG